MQSDLNKILIEGMLKNAVKDIHSSPGRTVRNLIDMALNFSKGRFQKRFLGYIQGMLQNPESAYYPLFTDIVTNVDMDLLINFGMNLGYNSCTKGAKLIRQIEEEKGFNVPWSLTLQIDEKRLYTDPQGYATILKQGVALGIYTYMLFFPSGDAEKLIPLFEGQPDCAFIIFLKGHQITDELMRHVRESKNVMVSVYCNEDMADACEKLRKNKMLFAIHQRYYKEDEESIQSGQWISKVLPYHPQAAILCADPSCAEDVRRNIYQYIVDARESQKYPVLFMDVVGDAWQVDNIISEDAYVVGFYGDGKMSTYDGVREEVDYNIFHSTLEEVLRNTIKK